MTPSGFVSCLICVLLWKKVEMMNHFDKTSVHQERSFMSTKVGDNVTLECFFDAETARYYWYKQSLGQKLQLISLSYKLEKTGTFYNEFKNKSRFSLETKDPKSRLKISGIKLSDTGTYFCASGVSFEFEFGEGVTVSLKDSVLDNIALVHQSESETIQPGSSKTLNCTVQTRSCSEEHSLYWFRNSGESDPGIIYTHEGRNNQCEKNLNTRTHTCVYNLPIRNITRSHIGTYYCAVASCGQVLFGNGTKLDLESEAFLVYFLGATLVFTIILSVLLGFILYKMNKRNSRQSSGFKESLPFQQATNTEVYQDGGSLHYAAVNTDQFNSSRRTRKSRETECVYSIMMQ